MRWLFSWRENGRLQVKVVFGTKAAQELEADLQDRNIYARVCQLKGKAS